VVLSGRQEDSDFAIDQSKQARFLADEELFDNHRSIARGLDRGFGLGARHGNCHALSGGKPVGLDHHRDGEITERRASFRHRINALVIGGRDAVRPAQILGEALGAFKLSRGRARTEDGKAPGSEGIADAGDERRFRANDDEIDECAFCKLDDGSRIARVERDAVRPARDPGIARRGNKLAAARRLPKSPRERILPAARTQEQNIHGSP